MCGDSVGHGHAVPHNFVDPVSKELSHAILDSQRDLLSLYLISLFPQVTLQRINPFNASCSKSLLFEGSSAMLL